MFKRIKILTLLLTVFAMCFPVLANEATDEKGIMDGWTAWYLGDNRQNGVRIGREIGDHVEFGLQGYFYTRAKEDPPDIFGGYVIYDFPGEIDLSKVPMFSAISNDIALASYLGYQLALELDDDDKVERGYHGPLIGLALTKFIFDEVDDQIITGTEFQYMNYTDTLEEAFGTDEEWRLLFFLRILF